MTLWGPEEKKKARTGDGQKDGGRLAFRDVFWRSQGEPRSEGIQLIKSICQNKLADKAEMPERG